MGISNKEGSMKNVILIICKLINNGLRNIMGKFTQEITGGYILSLIDPTNARMMYCITWLFDFVSRKSTINPD